MFKVSEEKDRTNFVTLELTSTGADEIGSVRKIEQSDGGIRLIVTLPRLIDGEQANLTAALLFQHLDRLPRDTVIERVKITGLHFSQEGVVGIQGFLGTHVKTIKHVSLKDMMNNGYSSGEAVAFASLAKVFQGAAKLETLNLSDNTICASLWKHLSVHTSLRQLILDFVAMDDDCLVELQNNFGFGETLEELYVVLTNRISEKGLGAANSILRSCKRLSSLRWAERDAPPEALMPWQGLADMSSNDRIPSTLLHLVMDGGDLLENAPSQTRLCCAIQNFAKLRTLKLRGIGINDDHVRRLVEALLLSRPPLEVFDLSKNHIKTTGALEISRLSAVEPLRRNLVLLALDRNKIDAGGARNILESFGGMGSSPRLDVRLEANQFHYSKLAFILARRKARAETERDELQIELMQAQTMLESSHGAVAKPETNKLHDEINKLREEKASLLKVLAIVSGSNHREDVTKTLDRISGLEHAVYGGTTGSEHTRRDSVSSQAKQLPKILSKASSDVSQTDSSQRSNTTTTRHKSRAHTNNITLVHSPTRKSHELQSPGGLASVSNMLIRGISERWGSPPQKKKSATVNQSPIQSGHKKRINIKHVESETNHSRGSASSSPRVKEASGTFSSVSALDHSTNSESYSSTRNG